MIRLGYMLPLLLLFLLLSERVQPNHHSIKTMFCRSVLSFMRRILNKKPMISSKPVVVIIGYTGAGKSKLAVEIAKKYRGEIINADAMQVTIPIFSNFNIQINPITILS